MHVKRTCILGCVRVWLMCLQFIIRRDCKASTQTRRADAVVLAIRVIQFLSECPEETINFCF